MSIFNSNVLAASNNSWNPLTVDQSAWFDGSADYLSWTPGSTGNRQEFALSFWVRRTGFGNNVAFFGSANVPSSVTARFFNEKFEFAQFNATSFQLTTTRLFRDTNWYHIVVSVDTNQATASDRIKVFINGEQETVFDTATYPTLGFSAAISLSGQNMFVGAWPDSAGAAFQPIPARISQATYLDGVSIQGADFTIEDLGQWWAAGDNGLIWAAQPDTKLVAQANTAGGNSFCQTSEIGDGTDASANGNDFTPTSMSHAANGSSDTPSRLGPVVDILIQPSSSTITTLEGGRRVTGSGGGDGGAFLSVPLPKTGKYEFQVKTNNGDGSVGICCYDAALAVSNPSNNALRGSSVGFNEAWAYRENGSVQNVTAAASLTPYTGGTALSANDVVTVRYDADAGEIQWLINNVLETTSTGVDTSLEFFPVVARFNNYDWTFLVFEDEFTYPIGSGYSALRVANNGRLATDPQGADWFNSLLLTGNATNDRGITGMGFASDLLWYKKRSAALSHKLQDVIRGVNNVIYSDSTNAEQVEGGFDSIDDADGFTINNANNANDSAATYVGWGFRAGGAGVTNNDGTITSTVSAAVAGHFSIIGYQGNATAGATIGHDLPGAPDLIIFKNRDTSRNWVVYCILLGAGNSDYLMLDQAGAKGFAGAISWLNTTAPDGSVITLGTDSNNNQNTNNHIAYAFRSVPGLCKVGSYTGNGSADGPMIWLGFTPRWVLIKRVDSGTEDWQVQDTARNPFNVIDDAIYANSSADEQLNNTAFHIDVLGDSVKIRTTHSGKNASGGLYLYLAMADIAGGGELPPILGR